MSMANTIGRHIDFWYDLSSTYSYPAAMRIECIGRRSRDCRQLGGLSCWGRSSRRKAGTRPRSISIRPRAATWWRDLEREAVGEWIDVPHGRAVPATTLLAARMALDRAGRGRWREEVTRRKVYPRPVRRRPAHRRHGGAGRHCGRSSGSMPNRPWCKCVAGSEEKLHAAETDEAQRLGLLRRAELVTPDG